MKMSTYGIIMWFGSVLLFVLAPLYDSMFVENLYPREWAYVGFAMAFPFYLLTKFIEDGDVSTRKPE